MVSYRWAYARIMAGTVLGGVLGFYVMHRLEKSYKAKMKERLAKYEEELNRRAAQQQQQQDQAALLPDSSTDLDLLFQEMEYQLTRSRPSKIC